MKTAPACLFAGRCGARHSHLHELEPTAQRREGGRDGVHALSLVHVGQAKRVHVAHADCHHHCRYEARQLGLGRHGPAPTSRPSDVGITRRRRQRSHLSLFHPILKERANRVRVESRQPISQVDHRSRLHHPIGRHVCSHLVEPNWIDDALECSDDGVEHHKWTLESRNRYEDRARLLIRWQVWSTSFTPARA